MRKKNCGFERVADHISQSAVSRQPFVEFRYSLRMHEDQTS